MFVRIVTGIRVLVLISVLCCLVGIPSQLKAQGYPQVYYLSHLRSSASGGSEGGPDWSSLSDFYYYFDPGNPLVVDAVHWIHDYHDWYLDYHTHVDSVLSFPGYMEQYDEYFTVRTPNGGYSYTPRFRVAKIDYQGYFLSDYYYEYPWSHNPQISIWYNYNHAMHQTMRLMKNCMSGSTYWQRNEYTIDGSGHRIQDTQYSSSDSLVWTPVSRTSYIYSSEPLGFNFDYEKYLPYMPFSIRNSVFCLDYLLSPKCWCKIPTHCLSGCLRASYNPRYSQSM